MKPFHFDKAMVLAINNIVIYVIWESFRKSTVLSQEIQWKYSSFYIGANPKKLFLLIKFRQKQLHLD